MLLLHIPIHLVLVVEILILYLLAMMLASVPYFAFHPLIQPAAPDHLHIVLY